MSSFSRVQVAHFRQVFSQFSDDNSGGVSRQNFATAVRNSFEGNLAGHLPSAQDLDAEFQTVVGDSGVVQWQQFFQVLIHLNLSVASTPPPEEPRRRSTSGTHVQFTAEVVDEAPPPSYERIQEEEAQGNTLGRSLLRSVGNFFGVTETSQRGGEGQIGWEQFNERSMEEPGLFSTLSRRTSFSHVMNQEQPQVPGYPAVQAGHSFDLNALGDDSDDEEVVGLTSAPPPSYSDIVESGLVSGLGQQPVGQEQHYPEPTHSRQSDDFIYNKPEAWQYYQTYIKAERRLRQRRHQTDAYEFFGSAGGGGQVSSENPSNSLRRGRLNSAEPQNSEVVRRIKKRKTKLQRQSTIIRTEVESLPSFWPIFIILVSLAQVLTVIVLLSIYGIAPIKPFPVKETGEFDSLSTVSTSDNISYFRGVNLWIGPSPLNLIQFGAKFTPCMRKDFGIRRRNGKIYVDNQTNFGCCQNQGLVGTTLISRCVSPTRLPKSNVTFFERYPTLCSSNGSKAGPPTFHPCCISITGHCEVMRLDECMARGGFYHENMDNCQDVNCFRSICGFNELLVSELNNEEGVPDPLSPNPQQFWRFFTSIFVHLGIIHLIIIMPIQLYVGIKIERTVGWLRVGIVYIFSGVGGNLISAIFIPYGVNAGASGAVFGLLGVLYVELFQFWQIVDRAWLELIKLTSFVVFLLALGTLPYVDNMSHIGGLLFGVPTAIIFVPYITFGKWDAVRKRILLIICIPLLLAMFVFGFLTFYIIPDTSFCSFCHYINCVPYAPRFCSEEFTNPNPSVFSL